MLHSPNTLSIGELYNKFEDLRALGIHEECIDAFNEFQSKIFASLRVSRTSMSKYHYHK